MKKKILTVITCLLLCVLVLSGCKDKDFDSIVEAYENINQSSMNGYSQTVTIKKGDFEYVSYSKSVEFNGESYKITEVNTVLNEIGAQTQTTQTTNVYYIDNGYIIKKVDGVFTKGEKTDYNFEGKYNLTKENISSYSIVKEDDKKVFTASIKADRFNSFVNTNLTEVSDMLVTINMSGENITSASLEYHKTNGSEITILTNLTSRYSNFAVPQY